MTTITKKFELGRVVATPSALALLTEASIAPTHYLTRHVTGEWGDLCDEDKADNEEAVKEGHRILSKYTVGEGSIYIITEWDRSVTTILLPEEY